MKTIPRLYYTLFVYGFEIKCLFSLSVYYSASPWFKNTHSYVGYWDV